MRHRWAAKQCLWLGPDRHRRRCGDTVTNPEPESYADSNSYAGCMRTDAIANPNGLTDCNRNRDCDGNGDNNSYCNSHGYRYRNGYG